MTELADHAYMGEIAISFSPVLFKALPGSTYFEDTAGIVFKLAAGGLTVTKFTRKMLIAFCGEMELALEKFPEADERGCLKTLLHDEEKMRDEARAQEISKHPIMMYLNNIPTILPDMSRAEKGQYVKFIHLNAYSDIFKFDISFADGASHRITIASSVAVYLYEAINDLYNEMR